MKPFPADNEQVRQLIRLAIDEDLGEGDVTTDVSVPASVQARANVVVREAGVVAGLPLIALVLGEFTDDASVHLNVVDGDAVSAGQVAATMAGPARALLSSERTILNFIRHLSGIATETRRYVDTIAGTRAKVFDTRKTTPGWRLLEKYAVCVGGAECHRMGLYDQVLIKDNHLALLAMREESLTDVVARIRREHPHILVEIEADAEDDVRAAVAAGADIILLDNMSPEKLYAAVKLVRKLAPKNTPSTEASGGVTLDTIRAVALTGVDRISVGAITHSARSLDVAVDFEAKG